MTARNRVRSDPARSRLDKTGLALVKTGCMVTKDDRRGVVVPGGYAGRVYVLWEGDPYARSVICRDLQIVTT